MTIKRIIAGFLLAPMPFVAPMTILFVMIIFGGPNDAMSAAEAWLELVGSSYGATILIGAPVHLGLTWAARRDLRSYLVATAICLGLVFAAAATVPMLSPPSPEQNPFRFILLSRLGVIAALICMTFAMAGASIYWAVSVRPRNAPWGRIIRVAR